MSAPPTSPAFPLVVSRLRAAGCVFAEDEARLLLASAGDRPEALDALVERRAAGEPLEHVVGHARFHGVRVEVGPGVFVPRRRTEFLVDRALALAPRPAVVLDLCCGSGAVGLALAAALGSGCVLHSADVDPGALVYARRNVAEVGGTVHEGDLFDAVPDALRGRIDVLTANVPYVPSDEVALLPAEARVHEPRVALDGGTDGLDLLRRVAARAAAWLAPGGHLLVETSERQADTALGVLRGAGLLPAVAMSQELYATVVTGRRP